MKAYKSTRAIWNSLNVEKKIHDVDVSQTSLQLTNELYQPLTVIARGDTTNTRDGRKLELSSIDMKLETWVDTLAPAGSNYTVRIVLVECVTAQQPSSLSDILDTAGFANNVTALRNIDTTPYYKVWRDISFNLSKDNLDRKTTELHLHKLNHKVAFTEADTTGASPIKGTLILMAFCSSVAINEVNLAGSCRVRFVDN